MSAEGEHAATCVLHGRYGVSDIEQKREEETDGGCCCVTLPQRHFAFLGCAPHTHTHKRYAKREGEARGSEMLRLH